MKLIERNGEKVWVPDIFLEAMAAEKKAAVADESHDKKESKAETAAKKTKNAPKK